MHSVQKQKAWRLAALFHTVFMVLEPPVDVSASVVPELCGWPPEETELALHALKRGNRICHEGDRVTPLPWSGAFADTIRDAVIRMDPDEAEGLFPYVRARTRGDLLGALEALIQQAAAFACAHRDEALRLASRLFLRDVRRVRPANAAEAQRFVALCREGWSMCLCAVEPSAGLIPLLLKGRALALRYEMPVAAAELGICLGGANLLDQPRHNDARLHALMIAGYDVLKREDATDILENHAYAAAVRCFMEGKFRLVADTLGASPVRESSWPESAEQTRRAILTGLAEFYMGESERAREGLRRALRHIPQPDEPAFTCLLRCLLADMLLEAGEDETALERLDLALGLVERSRDPAGWFHANRVLAVYHSRRPDRLFSAYTLLCNAMKSATRLNYASNACYARPLYILPGFLELLGEFDMAGLAPVPGLNLDAELRHCMEGPCLPLRGVALRVEGLRRLQRGEPDAGEVLEESLELFRRLHAYDEAAKSRLGLIRHALNRGEVEKAREYARIVRFRLRVLPPAIERLLPDIGLPSPRTENVPSEMDMLNAVLEPVQHGTFTSSDVLFSALTGACCMVFGLGEGLCAGPDPDSGELEVLGCYPENRPLPPARELGRMRDLAGMSLSGTPVLTTTALLPGREERTIICIPVCVRGKTRVLYMEGRLPARLDGLLNEALLARMGTAMAREVERLPLVSGALEMSLPRDSVAGTEEAGASGAGAVAVPFSDGGRDLVAESPYMLDFLRRVDLVAATDASVLISGESGVGKELVARRIHEHSGRPGAFVPVNLAGIPDDLFESELLGYERGAFTGAVRQKTGLLELADNGTLFLDELTDTSPRVQTKLLRLLQERTFLRLGGTRTLSSNFRLVAATNQDIQQVMADGAFREDLYYRICVVPLLVPPLRDRPEDIPKLARHYLRVFRQRHQRGEREIDAAIMARLVGWSWPGNVRELKNRMEQYVILGDPACLPPASFLSPHSSIEEGQGMKQGCKAVTDWENLLTDWERVLDRLAGQGGAPTLPELEERYIKAMLEACEGRIHGQGGAGERLGMPRSTLYARLHRHKKS